MCLTDWTQKKARSKAFSQLSLTKKGNARLPWSLRLSNVRVLTALVFTDNILRCPDKSVLNDVIVKSKLLQEERNISSANLALVLVHDLLLSNGIQAGDGQIKQAIFRHKTRLHSEFQRIKIKRGVKSDSDLAQTGDARAGISDNIHGCSSLTIPRRAYTPLR
jgi:hypothetical protein